MTAATLTPLPPKEAIRFFEPKGLQPAFAWQDVWQEEHAAAFTVAKMTQIDLLADVKASLDKALADGTTFDGWKGSVQPMLEARGWWGRAMMADPLDGELKSVQLGSPRRLRIIYDTNMRMSRAAGAWDRIQERKKARPFLRYVAVLDEKTRDDHRRWHGVILPVDHPFWATHYPPNGWKCRCAVEQLAARDLEREGWRVTSDADLDKTGWRETTVFTNVRTGETVKVPVGIDPGFAYNAGIAARLNQAQVLLAEKLAAAPPDIARRAGTAMLQSPAFERFLATAKEGEPDNWWPLPAPAALAKALNASAAVIRISGDTAQKQRGETARSDGHPELTAAEWALLPEILSEGEDFASKAGEKARARIKMIADRRYIAVVKSASAGRELYITSFRRLSDREYRRIQRKGMATAQADDLSGRGAGGLPSGAEPVPPNTIAVRPV